MGHVGSISLSSVRIIIFTVLFLKNIDESGSIFIKSCPYSHLNWESDETDEAGFIFPPPWEVDKTKKSFLSLFFSLSRFSSLLIDGK